MANWEIHMSGIIGMILFSILIFLKMVPLVSDPKIFQLGDCQHFLSTIFCQQFFVNNFCQQFFSDNVWRIKMQHILRLRYVISRYNFAYAWRSTKDWESFPWSRQKFASFGGETFRRIFYLVSFRIFEILGSSDSSYFFRNPCRKWSDPT